MTDKRIPFSLPDIRDEDIAAVEGVLRSGWLTTGARTHEFEKEFARYAEAECAVAVNSCTAALHIALEALGVRPDDVVLVPTYTFAATAEVVRYLDAIPVLVDSEPGSLTIDTGQLETILSCLRAENPGKAVSDATECGILARGTARTLKARAGQLPKAIAPVHFAGQACDMDRILTLADDVGMHVVEDAAHALESTYRGKKVGSIGDVTAFSFYATKNLCTGEGGMATTNDPDLAARMRQLTLHGMSRTGWDRYTAAGSWWYDIERIGYKYNLTDMASVLGLSQLARVEEAHARRVRIAERYREGLSGLPGIHAPNDTGEGINAWHLFVIRIDEAEVGIGRDRFFDELNGLGIGCSVHFIPLHFHSFYRETYGYEQNDFPIAADGFARSLSLPLYPRLTDSEVDRVIDAVRSISARFSDGA